MLMTADMGPENARLSGAIGDIFIVTRLALDAVTEDELELYCYRVAGTVGVVMAHVLGMHDTAWTGEYYLAEHPIHKLSKKDRLEVQIRGTELDDMSRFASEVVKGMREVPGIVDVREPRLRGRDEIAVRVDPEKAGALGLSAESLGRNLETYVRGRIVTRLRTAEEEVPVVLRLALEDREHIDQVKQLLVRSPQTGKPVPVREVATFTLEEGPIVISRDEGYRILARVERPIGIDDAPDRLDHGDPVLVRHGVLDGADRAAHQIVGVERLASALVAQPERRVGKEGDARNAEIARVAGAVALGGTVERTGLSEYGSTRAEIAEQDSTLFTGQPAEQSVWMSHGDSVTEAPEGMRVTASTSGAPVAAFEDDERQLYGVQWHPEVMHSTFGQSTLENFLRRGAGLEAREPRAEAHISAKAAASQKGPRLHEADDHPRGTRGGGAGAA